MIESETREKKKRYWKNDEKNIIKGLDVKGRGRGRKGGVLSV